MGTTLAEKVWADHLVRKGSDGAPDLLYIDLMLMHEVTSPQAFEGLRLAGRKVRLPGFVIPLERKGEEVVEFLLVPYYGACIHVPPPPSNQIVHVTSELGVLLDALYQPFWVEGPLKTEHVSSELAEVGYQMEADKIYAYELPDS